MLSSSAEMLTGRTCVDSMGYGVVVKIRGCVCTLRDRSQFLSFGETIQSERDESFCSTHRCV